MMARLTTLAIAVSLASAASAAGSGIVGSVLDQQGKIVADATVRLNGGAGVRSDARGEFRFAPVAPGRHRLTVEAAGFEAASEDITVAEGGIERHDVTLEVSKQHQSVVIEAKTLDPVLDLRNHEVYDRTLFTRDDQLLQQLNAGIDFGQH